MEKTKSKSPQAADKLRQQLKEMEGRYLRVLADYQNLEKRQDSQIRELAKYSAETVLDKLIPVYENLWRAQEHLKDEGLAMVIKQFQDTLHNEGLEEIKADKQEFDPETMDCVEQVPGPKNQVVSTLSGGWRFYDKVLRAAKVSVGNGK